MRHGPRLLIRLGSLGDVILATAAASAWKTRLGEDPLDVLVKQEWAEVFLGHPAVRTVSVWRPQERGVGGLLAWASRLRRAGYVEAVDLQGTTRTRFLTALAGVPVAGRPKKYTRARRTLVRRKTNGPPAGFRVVESFVRAVGGGDALPGVYPGTDARSRAEELLTGAGPVGLVPGARHATKQWPLERFARVGLSLHERWGLPVPLFLGPDEEELVRWFESQGNTGAWRPVRESISVAAAALARCRTVVTGDTGLMHLAAAVGTPVVALFGPTVLEFGFSPAGSNHRVLERELPCRPCSVHGGPVCPRQHFRCMLDINEEEVLRTVNAVLGAAA